MIDSGKSFMIDEWEQMMKADNGLIQRSLGMVSRHVRLLFWLEWTLALPQCPVIAGSPLVVALGKVPTSTGTRKSTTRKLRLWCTPLQHTRTCSSFSNPNPKDKYLTSIQQQTKNKQAKKKHPAFVSQAQHQGFVQVQDQKQRPFRRKAPHVADAFEGQRPVLGLVLVDRKVVKTCVETVGKNGML